MKFVRFFTTALSVVVLFSGCNALKTMASQTMAMKDCNYSYHSVSNIVIADIAVSEGVSAFSLPKIMTLIGGLSESLPVKMTLNLNVENPNDVQAGFERMAYQINLDSIRIAEGDIAQPFYVAPKDTSILPVDVSVDLRQLITKENSSTILSLATNLLGVGTTPSRLCINVRPTVKVLATEITAPNYIPITFEIGKKQ